MREDGSPRASGEPSPLTELREDAAHIGSLVGVYLAEVRVVGKVTDLIGCKDDFAVLIVCAPREGVAQDLQRKRTIDKPGGETRRIIPRPTDFVYLFIPDGLRENAG